MKKINFETLKVGDSVECLLNGKGVVEYIGDSIYNIVVNFSHITLTYTNDGKYVQSNLNPSLYLEAPKFSEYPKEMVVDGSIKTIVGAYSNYHIDKIGHLWFNAKDITPKRQLTKEQFKEEFGVEFDNIEIS